MFDLPVYLFICLSECVRVRRQRDRRVQQSKTERDRCAGQVDAASNVPEASTKRMSARSDFISDVRVGLCANMRTVAAVFSCACNRERKREREMYSREHTNHFVGRSIAQRSRLASFALSRWGQKRKLDAH